MDVVYARCCGLDVHQATVVACLVTSGADGQPQKEIRTFGTMTAALLALGDWLAEAGCTHGAMEGTGVYWKPVYNRLEERFTLLVVNARHVKAVPGRKTDVKDSEWLADLLRHGLLAPRFVPDRAERELRELTRYRSRLVQERAAEANRLQKTLEGANLKLGSVLSDVLGVSGRAILAALLGGETDPVVLAALVQGRAQRKAPELAQALAGRVDAQQRFLLGIQLRRIETLEADIAQVSAEIAERLRPFDAALERLDTIPGVGRRIAEILVAEVGLDMGRFPSASPLASWAGMCPGNNESAGKRKSGRTRKGSPWRRSALVEAAQAARHAKTTYLAAQYGQVAARRGGKRATIAVGPSILGIVYHILRDPQSYQELGADWFVVRRAKRKEHRLVEELRGLGYTVTKAAA
jgi:transposase